jgi:glycosyltransferase involved in cell wall biosynthesis
VDLVLVGNLPPQKSGTTVSLAEILGELARRGHHVRSLAPITPETRSPDGFAETHPAIRVTRFLLPSFVSNPYIPPLPEFRALQRRGIIEGLTDLVETRRPDVVVVGHETLVHGVPAFCRARGLPAVVLVRGLANALIAGRYPRHLAAELLQELGRADRVVAVAEHMARGLRALGLDRVTAIPNAVDTSCFRPGPRDGRLSAGLGLRPDATVVVHASNLKPVKRALDVVESAARALRITDRLEYVIVGDGLCRPEMEARCRAAGVAGRIRFAGASEYARMPDWIRLADLVLMPSESEGMARVYLETQACGRTLVASDIPAAREVICPGRTGILVPLGDIEALTTATLELAADPARRAAIGREAHAYAVAHHSLDQALARYEALFAELVRERCG